MPASDAAAGPALAHQVTPTLVRLLAAGQRGQRRLEAAARGHPDRDRGADQEEAEGEVWILSTQYLQYLRIQAQLDNFYKSIDQTKETQLRVDLESRKHHDTLLPNQKSPIPHNRWPWSKTS